jgi:tRNA threonylcarbamoyl adenosine modification protein (Sua5/YciO/YrdC/YwlC family)
MLIKLYNKNNNPKDLERIVQILEDGGIIIYPTDTMYAIGCHALKERPIERICHLKGIDPKKHSLSIICYDLSNISEYAKIDNATFKLMKRNLPGAFTFILPTGGRLPKIFKHRKEVGIRMPDHPIIREICQLLDAPILTTTLPLEDGEDLEYITTPELIEEKFGNEADLIIDGGPCRFSIESTILSLLGERPKLLREGAIRREEITEVIGPCD